MTYQRVDLPVRRDLTPAYRLSLVVAFLLAMISGAELALGTAGLYGADPGPGFGVREAEAGLLLPGLLGQAVFDLVVGVPLLLGSMWLARRGTTPPVRPGQLRSARVLRPRREDHRSRTRRRAGPGRSQPKTRGETS